MNTSTQENVTPSSVVVIGEYTTPSGPWGDDHFIVAVCRSGKLVELPSDKADAMISELENATGQKIEFGLCNRTDAASRVIYPAALAGRPLFDFARRSGGLLKLIRNFGVSETSVQLTEEIKAFIAASENEANK